MVWGVIIALLVAGIIYALGSSIKGGSPTILSWLVLLIVVVALSIESNRLIRSCQAKAQVSDIVLSYTDAVDELMSDYDGDYRLSREEAYMVALSMKSAMPGMSSHIKVSELEGQRVSAIGQILERVVVKAVNKSLWNIIGWILLTIVLGTVFVAVTMGGGNGRYYQGSSTTRSYDSDIDF